MADFSQIIQEINDDINTNGVGAITGAKLNQVLRNMIAAVNAEKQDPLTIDAMPTEDSTNPVQSGGVYEALEDKADKRTFEVLHINQIPIDIASGLLVGDFVVDTSDGRRLYVVTYRNANDFWLVTSDGVNLVWYSYENNQYSDDGFFNSSIVERDILELNNRLDGKQDTISDLADIRSGAAAGATAYQKPSGGIPKTDLASGVQTSLGKADTAFQKPSGGIPASDLATAVQTSLGKADTAVQQVTVGTTTTGNAGTNASVTNSGTVTNPVLDFTIPRGADGANGQDGADAVNPFKGWFDSANALPANPAVGDYAYVKGASSTDPAAIYECTTAGTWSDSGRTADTSNVQTFASGEEVNEVHIVNDVTTGGVHNVLSAEQGKTLDGKVSQLEAEVSDLEQIVDITRTPTSNLLDLDAITEGYYWWIYGQQASASLFYSAHIPVIPGETYTMQRTTGGGRELRNIRMIVGYKADDTRVASGSFENVMSYVPAEDCAYVIVTGYVEDKPRDIAFVKSATVIPYEPYGEIVTVRLKDGTVAESNIVNGAVSTNKIADGAVTIPKLAITTEVKPKNLLNPALIVTGKWIGATGNTENVVSDFGYYDYIGVDAETNYHISNSTGTALCDRTDAYIAFYDSSKAFISSVDSKQTDITTPAGCAYVRISVRFTMTTDAQMETGTTRTSYEAYFDPYLVIDPQYISFPDNGVTTPKIADGAVTQSKIADGVSLPASPRQFGSIRLSDGTLSPGEILKTDNSYYISKNIAFVALIKGTIESVEVGTNRNGSTGEWVEVTPTQIKTKYGTSGTVNQTYTHGLTLGTRTKVVIEKTVDKDNQATAIVRLIDDFGNIFQQSVTWFGSAMGNPFIYNNNTSGNIDAELSVMFRDITKTIWMFGDSYFNYEGPTRWPYYAVKWGFDNFLLNGRGGENATEAYADFQHILAFGEVPSYCVWCLGMNSGKDTNGAVNPTWLSITQQFISDCEGLGIEPILATIPSVPTEIHTKLNEWVRTSGYRYIDFAEAVENGNDYYWRGWGTENALLSNDEVHPTAHGAAELACRAFQDFPEITIRPN